MLPSPCPAYACPCLPRSARPAAQVVLGAARRWRGACARHAAPRDAGRPGAWRAAAGDGLRARHHGGRLGYHGGPLRAGAHREGQGGRPARRAPHSSSPSSCRSASPASPTSPPSFSSALTLPLPSLVRQAGGRVSVWGVSGASHDERERGGVGRPSCSAPAPPCSAPPVQHTPSSPSSTTTTRRR